MNFKSFLASSALSQVHKITIKTSRGSRFGINTRISQSQFDLIKDDYIKSVAEATGWPAHYIRVEWLNEDEVLVKYAIPDGASREDLQAKLDGDQHHIELSNQLDANQITGVDVISVDGSQDHPIPGKPYVMIL